MSRANVLAVFAVALAVRLVHIWQIRSAPFFALLMGDSGGYDEWARRIAGGDWIGQEVFYQAPLYPYFLGVVYAIAGHSLLLVRLVQAVVGSASCALLALAAARLFSPRAGVVAGVMLALYAPAIFFDGLLQKTVLDVFFVCLMLWIVAGLILRQAQDERKGWLALGLVMGALALTRENALVLIVVILGWSLFRQTAHPAPVEGWRLSRALRVHLVPFLLGLAIVLAPVVARNYYVGGGVYITTAQFGPNFYIGNNARADGTYASLRYGRGAPEFERQDATELAEHAVGRKLTPSEVSGYWTDRALAFIKGHPVAWARLVGRKTALVWNRTEMVDTEDQATHAESSIVLRLLGPVTHFGVLVPLALLGIIVTWPRRRELWVLYAMVLAYAASVVMFYVFARYRFPLVPFLILFGAVATTEGLSLVTKSKINPQSKIHNPKFSGAAVLTAAALTNWPLLSTAYMRAVTENNLGVALQEARRYDEAAQHYQRAVAFRDDYAPAYSNLGTALKAQGRTAEAIASYERAIRAQPEYPDAHFNLANALKDAGRMDAAIEHYQTALRSVPLSVEAHNNLAIALASAGRVEDARAEFEAALRLDPHSANVHRNLGDLLSNMAQVPRALDHFRRATELAPDDGEIHYDYGSLLLDTDQPAAAERELRTAARLLPRSAKVRNNLGIALGFQGKLNEAIEQLQEAVKIDPTFTAAQRNLATALGAKKGRP